jgi:hypothetical protein
VELIAIVPPAFMTMESMILVTPVYTVVPPVLME